MTWSFLAPWYLLGALALAAPIIAHLRGIHSEKPYLFPTLRFLLQSYVKVHRWSQLMKYLLLLLRILIFLALILAFAQPWKHARIPPGGGATVILIDVSASMAAGNAWEQARDVAVQRLNQESSSSATALVLMGRVPRILGAFEDSLSEKQARLARLGSTLEGTDTQAGIDFSDRLLAAQPSRSKKIIVISDMAESAWKSLRWDDVLSPGVKVQPERVGSFPMNNVAVTRIVTPPSFWQTNETVRASALIQNHGNTPRELPLQASIDGEIIHEQMVSVAGKSSQEVSFTFKPAEFRPVRLRIGGAMGDDFPADDERFAVIPAKKSIRVGRLKTGNFTQDRFLQLAVAPHGGLGQGPYQWIRVDPLDPGELEENLDVLILDSGTSLSGSSRVSLQKYLQSRKPVWWVLGESSKIEAKEKARLPIELGAKREVGSLSKPQGLGQVMSTHPILQRFFLPRSGDLFRVKFYQWREFNAERAEVLIRLENSAPIFAVLEQDGRRVAVQGFEWNREWSNWPVQTTFLPFVQKTLGWLTEKESQAQNLVVGDLTSDGKATEKPGFYVPSDDKLSNMRAVNLDPLESDLSRWTALDRFRELENPETEASPVLVTSRWHEVEGSTNWIWWLLFFALLLSIPELGLANRTPR